MAHKKEAIKEDHGVLCWEGLIVPDSLQLWDSWKGKPHIFP